MKRASKLRIVHRNKRIVKSTYCVRRKLSAALMVILNRSGGAFFVSRMKGKDKVRPGTGHEGAERK